MIELISLPTGTKIRIRSEKKASTVWLLVPGMWHTSSACFGKWPIYIAAREDTASAVLVLRGHSRIDRESRDNYASLAEYVEDVRDALSLLSRRFDHIIVCGHSMGGILVHLALQSPPQAAHERIRAVVTLCESTSIVPKMVWNTIMSKSLLPILSGEPFKPHPADVKKYVLDAGWDLGMEPSFGYESGRAVRDVLLGKYKLDFAAKGRPKVPHLVVGSINDPIVPCAAVAKTYHRMVRAGINAHYLTVIPGGHMIMHCNSADNTIDHIMNSVNGYISMKHPCRESDSIPTR